MKLKLLRKVVFVASSIFLNIATSTAQGIFTGINSTVINLPCTQACTNLNFQVPHLKSDDDYQVVTIPYTPYPYTTATGNELTALYADDKYSQAITLPFPICFYGAVYNQVVVGSNGLLTFDIANASCDGAYTVSPAIPYGLGTICNQGSTYYPRAAVMGAYSDLDPQPAASPADRKIEWRMEGTAPFRRFVASWYKVGVFGNNSCGRNRPTTFQIVINESTSVVEVFFEQKICTDASTGNAILGVQDWARINGIAAPGKNATVWGARDEGYRFVPSGAVSRFVNSQLFLLNGATPIATAATANVTAGLIDISFPNVCPPSASQQYVVKTTYSSCINPAALIVIEDTVTINRNPELFATAVTTNTACGSSSGTITITVPPGTGIPPPPYTYILDPGPGQVTQTGNSPNTFTNVAQGAHIVVVRDAGSGNCNSTINVIVNRTNDLAATVTPTPPACAAASNGSILVVPANGTAPFTFLLNPGSITQTGATTTFTGLSPGSYTVVVTDVSGCISNSLPAIVGPGIPLTTTVSKTDVLCNGGATGSITVTQPIGTAPFQYSLDGITWQASNIFPGLTAGIYTVFFRESSGCQGVQSITIGQPTTFTAINSVVPVSCNGQSNGTITITANGGISPYQYSINGGTTWQNSNVFTIVAGTYTITIRDANNCAITQTVTVAQPPPLNATSINGPASCNGGNDGTITVTATGGNTGYQYSLDGTTFQASNVLNAGPGNYTITVRDNLGCSTTFNTTVVLGSNFTLTPQADATICEGTSTQLSIVSNATQYAWTPVAGLSSTTIANPVANPTVTTQYTVTATLGNCSGTDVVIVNVNAAPIPNAGPDGFVCYGQTYQLQGSGGTQYSWSPATYLNNAAIPNPIANAGRDITYALSILSDINGCASLTTDQVRIDVTPPIIVKTFPSDTIGYTGDQFQLLAVPSDSDVISYVWTPAAGLSDPRIANPMVTVGFTGDVTQYQVTTSTIAGCKGEGYVTIRVYKGPDIYVPSGFTPNNDGKNDRFTPFPVGMKSYNYFRIFNRWGHLVFTSSTLHDGWDGKLGGRDQQSGVFVWMIEGTTKDGRVIKKKGTVTLIR